MTGSDLFNHWLMSPWLKKRDCGSVQERTAAHKVAL